jgi:hypothetical protein
MEIVMATAKNDVTGDFIKSKPSNDMFEENFDKIFRKKKPSDDVSPHLHEYELNKSTGEVQKVCECGVKGCE